jgi:mono/diheme cytochrome c family protein
MQEVWSKMKKNEEQKNRWIATLGIVLAISLFVNVAVVWHSVVSSPGFRIAEGDAALGELAFEELNCVRCHTVAGVDRFSLEAGDGEMLVPLGGEVRRVKTYGDLITAIIHPSDSIRPDVLDRYEMPDGESLMPDYSTAMTTGQLRDIATFLEAHYELKVPEYPRPYSPYNP